MNFRCLASLVSVICSPLSSGYTASPDIQVAGSMPISNRFQIQAPPELSPAHLLSGNPPPAEFDSPIRGLDYDKKFSQERKEVVAFPETPTGEIPPGAGALV